MTCSRLLFIVSHRLFHSACGCRSPLLCLCPSRVAAKQHICAPSWSKPTKWAHHFRLTVTRPAPWNNPFLKKKTPYSLHAPARRCYFELPRSPEITFASPHASPVKLASPFEYHHGLVQRFFFFCVNKPTSDKRTWRAVRFELH